MAECSHSPPEKVRVRADENADPHTSLPTFAYPRG
jgi:hypothetical protein